MIVLAQEFPTLPADTPAWLLILVMLLSTASYMLKRWFDNRLDKEKAARATAENKVVSLQRQLNAGTEPLVILYVDDNANDYELLRHMLASVGCEHRIVWFSNPADGYIYMRENDVLLCLVDIKMVDNGKRFLDTVKADSRTRDVPVIVVSGVVPEDISIYRRGAIGYLPKPLQLSALLQSLSRHGISWSLSQSD